MGGRAIGGEAAVVDALVSRIDGGAYTITFPAIEMSFLVERLHWDRDELKGHLTVHCGLAGARTIGDNVVNAGTFNLSSTRTRRERAKEIADRVRGKIDFVGLLEEVCHHVLREEQRGEPSIM